MHRKFWSQQNSCADHTSRINRCCPCNVCRGGPQLARAILQRSARVSTTLALSGSTNLSDFHEL